MAMARDPSHYIGRVSMLSGWTEDDYMVRMRYIAAVGDDIDEC